MRRTAPIIITALALLCCAISTALAVECVSYYDLRDMKGPATVHVIAKSDVPSRTDRGAWTDSTRWEWLIQEEEDQYFGIYVYTDMNQYRALPPDKQVLIRNHIECDLTITIDGEGHKTIGDFKEYHAPIWTIEVVGVVVDIILMFLVMVLFAVIIYTIISKADVSGKSRTPARRTGIPLWMALLGTWEEVSRKRKRRDRERRDR